MKTGGELELTLYEIDARSWLGEMALQSEKWLPTRRDRLVTYTTPDNQEVVGALIPFGNATAVKFRISRTLRGWDNQLVRFTENIHYSSCGNMLIRIPMRSESTHFDRLENSVFDALEEQFICARR